MELGLNWAIIWIDIRKSFMKEYIKIVKKLVYGWNWIKDMKTLRKFEKKKY